MRLFVLVRFSTLSGPDVQRASQQLQSEFCKLLSATNVSVFLSESQGGYLSVDVDLDTPDAVSLVTNSTNSIIVTIGNTTYLASVQDGPSSPVTPPSSTSGTQVAALVASLLGAFVLVLLLVFMMLLKRRRSGSVSFSSSKQPRLDDVSKRRGFFWNAFVALLL